MHSAATHTHTHKHTSTHRTGFAYDGLAESTVVARARGPLIRFTSSFHLVICSAALSGTRRQWRCSSRRPQQLELQAASSCRRIAVATPASSQPQQFKVAKEQPRKSSSSSDSSRQVRRSPLVATAAAAGTSSYQPQWQQQQPVSKRMCSAGTTRSKQATASNQQRSN